MPSCHFFWIASGQLMRSNLMPKLSARQILTLLIHALVGWALCAATMGIGMAVTTLQTTLIVHAVGAPIFFFGVSYLYFTRFNYTSPLQTAILFTGFVILVDFFLVALIINRSLEMFTSPLGTWIPFALIFISTYLTGLMVNRGTITIRPA
jgi:hypothetical protein